MHLLKWFVVVKPPFSKTTIIRIEDNLIKLAILTRVMVSFTSTELFWYIFIRFLLLLYKLFLYKSYMLILQCLSFLWAGSWTLSLRNDIVQDVIFSQINPIQNSHWLIQKYTQLDHVISLCSIDSSFPNS